MKASVHQYSQLEPYSVGDIEPVKLIVQYSLQAAVVLEVRYFRLLLSLYLVI